MAALENCNLFIFQGVSWSLKEIIRNSYSWAIKCMSTSTVRLDVVTTISPYVQRSGSRIVLNSNGVVNLASRSAVVGGVARDINGDWLFGYNWYLGKCSIF